MARWFCLCILLTASLLPLGCSSKGDDTVGVSGTVNLDSKPLSEGTITFAGDPGTVPAVLTVKNGSFEGQVKPGKKKVQIMAYKATKAPPTATETTDEFKENYIPARFNTESKLTAEVTASGLSPNKFDVESK